MLGQIMHDYTYMKSLKQSNLEKQKIEWWLSGDGESRKWAVKSVSIKLQLGKMSLTALRYNIMPIASNWLLCI